MSVHESMKNEFVLYITQMSSRLQGTSKAWESLILTFLPRILQQKFALANFSTKNFTAEVCFGL